MSEKVVAIQQPEHLPWIGFFDKMAHCDSYVYLDNVQFKKRYFENRNRIRTPEGSCWVTVPVYTKGSYHQKICDVLIDNEQEWRRKYLGTIKQAYARATGYGEYMPILSSIIEQPHKKLVELNIALIEWLRKCFSIGTSVITASGIRVYDETGSDLILAICKDCDATIYVSGPDGRNYLNHGAFAREGVRVVYHDYQHPQYQQLASPFVSHMSALDLLMNCGKEGKRFFEEEAPWLF